VNCLAGRASGSRRVAAGHGLRPYTGGPARSAPVAGAAGRMFSRLSPRMPGAPRFPMLHNLKRFFGRHGDADAAARAWPELSDWAAGRQFMLREAKGVKGAEGLVIDGQFAAQPWRLEWGPSQRPYIRGTELRLRADVGRTTDVQAMVLDRALQAAMEASVFEQYVESVQTRIDSRTPPEMRWLVMFPKVPGSELGGLKERFSGVANVKGWIGRWLEGPLAAALADVPLAAGQPVVLLVSRGRVGLRTALPEPTVVQVGAWVAVFEAALGAVLKAGRPEASPPSAAA